MRCSAVIDGRRCQEEEGHDTGVGTPHLLFADAGAVTSAAVAARELSERLGIPCTATGYTESWSVGVPRVVDDGDLTCVQTDGTPEGAARQLEAMWAALEENGGGVAALASQMRQRRRRVTDAILAYLTESERDWHAMFVAAPGEGAVAAIQDAKQLHDAQVAELFERIGAAL